MRNFGQYGYTDQTGADQPWYTAPITAASQAAAEWWYGPDVSEQQKGGADAGIIGGACVDHHGLMGTPGRTVSCASLAAVQQGSPAETYVPYTDVYDPSPFYDPPPTAPAPGGTEKKVQIPVWLYFAVAGVGATGAYLYFKRMESR